MTYYGGAELARSFRTVRKNTIQIAEEVPEEKYGFRVAEGCRTVGETLVHIAVTTRVPEQIHIIEHRSTLVGFDFFALMGKLQAEVKTPRTKAQILDCAARARSTAKFWKARQRPFWRRRFSIRSRWSRG